MAIPCCRDRRTKAVTGAYLFFASVVIYIVGYSEPFWSYKPHDENTPDHYGGLAKAVASGSTSSFLTETGDDAERSAMSRNCSQSPLGAYGEVWCYSWEYVNLGLRSSAMVCMFLALSLMIMTRCGQVYSAWPRVTISLAVVGASLGVAAEILLLILHNVTSQYYNPRLTTSLCLCGFSSIVALVSALILSFYYPPPRGSNSGPLPLPTPQSLRGLPVHCTRDGWLYCHRPFNWTTLGDERPTGDVAAPTENDVMETREKEPLLAKQKQGAEGGATAV